MREILATEMLEALGVDTSKSFSLIETGEDLERGDEPSPTRSSVLVRLSHSHIRIGTFQRFLYLNEPHNLRKLLDYSVRTYMPEVWRDDEAARAAAFLEEVCRRVARMGAQWMAAGFVHGVLNTDNINVTGESFDYGPWRFLPSLRSRHSPPPISTRRDFMPSAASPTRCCGIFIASRNACFRSRRRPALSRRWLRSNRPCTGSFAAAILRRLGLQSQGVEQDGALAKAVWTFLHESKAPFEQTFFDWYGGALSAERAKKSPISSAL